MAVYRFTGFHKRVFRKERDVPCDFLWTITGPGLIDEGYARKIFGDDFDKFVTEGLLTKEHEDSRECTGWVVGAKGLFRTEPDESALC